MVWFGAVVRFAWAGADSWDGVLPDHEQVHVATQTLSRRSKVSLSIVKFSKIEALWDVPHVVRARIHPRTRRTQVHVSSTHRAVL